jgi:triacylglycerol lipase
VHGFSGWNDIAGLEYFFDVVDELAAEGVEAYAPPLPPYASSTARAEVLEAVLLQLLDDTHAAKVHLVGHSQGGLDLRAAVQHIPVDRIASITTVATPHQGSHVADLAADAPDGMLNPAGNFLAWIVTGLDGAPPADLSGDAQESDAWTPELADAIRNLQPANARAFSAAHPWPAGVPVASVAGVSNLLSLDQPECAGAFWDSPSTIDDMDPLFVAAGAYLSWSDGGTIDDPIPNDGLVTVESAKDGVFLGCIPADHLDEIGQLADFGSGLLSGFEHVELYRRIVAHVRTFE